MDKTLIKWAVGIVARVDNVVYHYKEIGRPCMHNCARDALFGQLDKERKPRTSLLVLGTDNFEMAFGFRAR